MFNGKRVKHEKVKEYFDEYYHSAVMIYNRYKRFGLPFTGGWAQQPEYLINVLELFDATIDAYGRHRMEKEQKKHGNSRRATNTNKR